MPLEIEAKIKVEHFDPIRRRLEELSATLEPDVQQHDTFFDTAEGALAEAGCGLRLRRESQGLTERALLTYKGPRQKGPYKAREEIEFGVSQATSATDLLERLGLRPGLVVEKHRQVARLESCLVCLDEVNALGLFVEIEGPSVEEISRIRALLGLQEQPVIRKGYAALLRKKGVADAVRERGG